MADKPADPVAEVKDSRLRDHLHDEIDAQEKMLDRSTVIVRETIAKRMRALIDKHDFHGAFVEVAQEIEEQLTDLTTESFQTGARMAKERYSKR